MFGNKIELLQETYYSIKHNQRRSFLSGFGIAWGILLLAILLGVGSGFQAGIMGLFQSFAQKSLMEILIRRIKLNISFVHSLQDCLFV